MPRAEREDLRMTFYQLGDQVREIRLQDIHKDMTVAAYMSGTELADHYQSFGFDPETVEECQKANPMFRTGEEIHRDYSFTQIRIASDKDAEDDWIAMYLKRNFILVVDIRDEDNSTRNAFLDAIHRFSSGEVKIEKIVCQFLETLVSGGRYTIEKSRNEIADMEELVVTGETDQNFTRNLLNLKKKLLKQCSYYEQILDVAEALEDNENGILDDANLIYISNLKNKVTRLLADTSSLSDSVDHLQDAYSSFLDMKLNQKMNILTVITTIFFPLTIIGGWYGMNFQAMPEFGWKYGYVYVIVLSVTVVTALLIIGKKKKWF